MVWLTTLSCFFFLNDTAPPEISPLSLHDALPISAPGRWGGRDRDGRRAALAFAGRGDRRRTRGNTCHHATRAHRGHGDVTRRPAHDPPIRSEEHTSELQSQSNLVCRLLLEKKKIK